VDVAAKLENFGIISLLMLLHDGPWLAQRGTKIRILGTVGESATDLTENINLS
jgi:hypothetical protein